MNLKTIEMKEIVLYFFSECVWWNISSSFFFFFLLFRAVFTACGSSQDRSSCSTWDPSHICGVHHDSQQCYILDPLSKARDQTCISWVLVGFATTEPRWEFPIRKYFQEIISLCLFQPQVRKGFVPAQM